MDHSKNRIFEKSLLRQPVICVSVIALINNSKLLTNVPNSDSNNALANPVRCRSGPRNSNSLEMPEACTNQDESVDCVRTCPWSEIY